MQIQACNTTVIFELRASPTITGITRARVATFHSSLNDGMRWCRSVRWWSTVAFVQAAGNQLIVQVIAERSTPVTRIDNVFAAWLRVLQSTLTVGPLPIPTLYRAEWCVVGPWQIRAEVRVLPVTYADAVAGYTASAQQCDEYALVCNSNDPLPPPPLMPGLDDWAPPPPSAAAPSTVSGSAAAAFARALGFGSEPVAVAPLPHAQPSVMAVAQAATATTAVQQSAMPRADGDRLHGKRPRTEDERGQRRRKHSHLGGESGGVALPSSLE